jgi:hypothetical protein
MAHEIYKLPVRPKVLRPLAGAQAHHDEAIRQPRRSGGRLRSKPDPRRSIAVRHDIPSLAPRAPRNTGRGPTAGESFLVCIAPAPPQSWRARPVSPSHLLLAPAPRKTTSPAEMAIRGKDSISTVPLRDRSLRSPLVGVNNSAPTAVSHVSTYSIVPDDAVRPSALAPGSAPCGRRGPAPTVERTGKGGGVGVLESSGYLGDRQLGVEQQLTGERVMALLAELAIGGA